jgi:hypothetical protein
MVAGFAIGDPVNALLLRHALEERMLPASPGQGVNERHYQLDRPGDA